MKRRNKILAWTGGVVLTLLVVLVLVIALFDWNRLKPFINAKVSEAIGRPFAINGDLSVAWRRAPAGSGWRALVPWPEFTARDINVANPAWAAQQPFAHLDWLSFRLSPLPLLVQHIVVPQLQLGRPVVNLQRNAQGQATWDFTLPASDGAPSRWQLELGAIGFDQGAASLDDAPSRLKLQIGITPLQQAIPYDQLVAQQSSEARQQAGKTVRGASETLASGSSSAAPASASSAQGVDTPNAPVKDNYLFAWQAKGSYQGTPVDGSGKTGGVLALQRDDVPFPLQADAHIGDSHIALVGTLTDPLHLGALDVRLWFSGSSMAKLYPIIGVTLPDTKPYATEGHLRANLGRYGSRFSYENFKGRVGGSDLNGSLLFVTGGARPKLSGQLHAHTLRFDDLAPLIGADSNSEKKQRGDAAVQPADKLLPVEPFRTDRWKAMDADVAFVGDRIVGDGKLPFDALSTHLVLNAGDLELDPLNLKMAGGTVESRLGLAGSQTPMQGDLRLRARHLKLKQLFPSLSSMQTSLGEVNGDAALSAHGNSVAALLGSANGEVKLLVNDGAISRNLMEIAGLNVGNYVVGKLFGDQTVKINCAAADLTARNGLMDSKLFVFDTADAIIDISGNVNFATERMDLDIHPHTKGFRVFSLRSPLYVRGSFKNPSVGVQTGTLLLRGGGAIALGVLATPVAALLPLAVPSQDKDTNTCSTVLQQMSQPAKVHPPTKKAAGRR